MTKRALTPEFRRIAEIIEELRFGRIEKLTIRNGEPCDDPAPRIVQEIKLGSERQDRTDHCGVDVTLKKEFTSLFNELLRLRDGVVDIEVHHGLPFRLVIDRACKASRP